MGEWGWGLIEPWVINKMSLLHSFGFGMSDLVSFPIVPYLEPYNHAIRHPFNMIVPNPLPNDQ
jgi:hypothetical protein